jgi:glutathione S-transferase
MIELYDHQLSGNCYKVRLLLSQLGVNYERITTDIFKGEHKTEEFRRLNPDQKIPVIRDGDLVLWESNAILLYLAKKYSPNPYYSEELGPFGLICQWLIFGKTSIDPNLAVARFLTRFANEKMRDSNMLKRSQDSGYIALKILNDHLEKNEFLANHYSIADIACFPYVDKAEEGGISLLSFPSVRNWCERIYSQPSYIPIY